MWQLRKEDGVEERASERPTEMERGEGRLKVKVDSRCYDNEFWDGQMRDGAEMALHGRLTCAWWGMILQKLDGSKFRLRATSILHCHKTLAFPRIHPVYQKEHSLHPLQRTRKFPFLQSRLHILLPSLSQAGKERERGTLQKSDTYDMQGGQWHDIWGWSWTVYSADTFMLQAALIYILLPKILIHVYVVLCNRALKRRKMQFFCRLHPLQLILNSPLYFSYVVNRLRRSKLAEH